MIRKKIKNRELKIVRADESQFVYSVFINDNQLIGLINNTDLRGGGFVWTIVWEQDGESFLNDFDVTDKIASYNLLDEWYLEQEGGADFDVFKIFVNGVHVSYLAMRTTINNVFEAAYLSGVVAPIVFPSPTFPLYLEALRNGLNLDGFTISKENPLTFSQDTI